MKRLILFVMILALLASTAYAAKIDSKVLEEIDSKGSSRVIIKLKEPPASVLTPLTVNKQNTYNKINNINIRNIYAVESHLKDIRKSQDKLLSDINYVDIKEAKANIKNIYSTRTKSIDLKLKHKLSSVNSISGEITALGLDKIRNNPLVESIYIDQPVSISLSESVPLINADDVWNLSINGTRINGTGETVCVIDTGIDYTHPALGGCTNDTFLNGSCSKVIGGHNYCADDTCSTESRDPFDNQGHGTHVAGIIASEDSTYTGAAPGAKIVALKALNSTGEGSFSGIDSALDWCISNSSIFNISIISMSLGTAATYSSNCDSILPSTASLINTAVSKNITVIAASGNSYIKTGISAPACIANATSVGATDKSDNIPSYSNSASILDLLAPGGSTDDCTNGICSTKLGGGFVGYYGTSMAAPHVSGAVALLRQYKRLSRVSWTPSQLIERLKATGVDITDTNSITKPRIDILAAIIPTINFTSPTPVNNTFQQNNNLTINVTSSFNISSALLEWDNGTAANLTMIQSTPTNFYYSFANLSDYNYTYKVYGNDTDNIIGVSETRTLTIDTTPPSITDHNRTPAGIYSNTTVTIRVNITDSNINTTLIEGSWTGTPTNFSLYQESPSLYNYTINSSELNRGEYITYKIIAADKAGNSNTTQYFNFTVLNLIPSQFQLLSPGNSYTTNNNTINFSWNRSTDQDNDTITYYLEISNSSQFTYLDKNLSTTDLSTTTNITEGAWYWRVKACDQQNCTYSASNYSFTIDTTSPTIAAASINSLTFNNTLTLSAQLVNVSWELSTNNISSNKLYIDGTEVYSNSSITNHTYTAALRAGRHTINITVVDSANNPASNYTILYLNKEENTTLLSEEISNSDPDISSVTMLKDNLPISGSTYLNSTIGLIFNLSGSNVNLSFEGLKANWNKTISIDINTNTSSAEASRIINNTNVDISRIVLFTNISEFLDIQFFNGTVITFTNAANTTDIFYISDDYGNNITKLGQCSNNSAPLLYNTINLSCYTYADNGLTLYVPHLSGGAIGNDTTPPAVTLTTPQNNSVINNSYFNLSFNVTEANPKTEFCIYNITSAQYSAQSTLNNTDYTQLTGNEYSYQVQIENLTNNRYNLTINCTDMNNLSSSSLTGFNISDTTNPVISGLSVSKTTSSAVITFSTDEYANASVRYGTNSSTLTSSKNDTSYLKSHSISLSGLSSGTAYHYNITYCDINNNCLTNGTNSFTTSSESTATGSSSPGGGGGGGAIIPAKDVKTQVFSKVKAGEENKILFDNLDIPLSKITFKTDKDLSDVEIKIRSLLRLDTDEVSNLSEVYRYLKFTAKNIKDDDISSIKIYFNVSKGWASQYSISDIYLAHYTGRWEKLPTSITSLSGLQFLAVSPGFSYFAIAGEKRESAQHIASFSTEDNTSIEDNTKNSTSSANISSVPEPIEVSSKKKYIILFLFILAFAAMIAIVYLSVKRP